MKKSVLAGISIVIIIVISGLFLGSNSLNQTQLPTPTSTPKPTPTPVPTSTPTPVSTVEIDHIDYFLVSDKGDVVQATRNTDKDGIDQLVPLSFFY